MNQLNTVKYGSIALGILGVYFYSLMYGVEILVLGFCLMVSISALFVLRSIKHERPVEKQTVIIKEVS